jgi:hypothetical protein
MLRLAKDLWTDQAGFVISAEMVLISTVGVIGLGTGLVAVRDAVNSELAEVACAITALDQSYCYTGFHSYKDPCRRHIKAHTAGSSYLPYWVAATADVECEPVSSHDEPLHPIPEHDPRPHFRERDYDRDGHQDHEEQIIEERVIRRPMRTRQTDAEDSPPPARRLPLPPPKLPGLTPSHDPAPDHPKDR